MASQDTNQTVHRCGKQTRMLQAYLVILPLLLLYILVTIWPEAPVTPGQPATGTTVSLFTFAVDLHPETRLLLIAILAGALGSYIHAATSFSTYVGNRTLVKSWILWYYLRPFIGAGLALMFYFLLRGGLLLLVTNSQSHEEVSDFGIAAVASLAGMFSKQATDKLREVFDSLFKAAGDQERTDKLGGKRPVKGEMIKRSEIQCYRLQKGETPDQVNLRTIYALLRPRVTRIPVLNADDSLNCLIHQSLLYQFISQESIDAVEEDPPKPLDFEDLTLEKLLASDEVRKMAQNMVAFVGPDATIADAKAEMDRIDGCQDVVVTQSGERNSPVIGWLTNGMIVKLARA